MKIKDIELIYLDLPMHEVPDRNMARANIGWRIIELCRVTTDTGLVGMGETLPHYTWCKVTPAAVERAKGRNPFELLWDDSLGAGLQMAVLDLCGKAAGVPSYQLLGKKHRSACPISWWGIDMSPEDYAREAADAVKAGYMSFKQKVRPWWDWREQIRLTAAAVPRNFKFDYDFNEHLLTASNAVTVLRELDKCENIAIYEEPIPRGDIEGNRRVRAATRCAIAFHYVGANAVMNIREEMCDGYVLCGGASYAMKAGHLCAEANKLFWLQMVGTAWTTSMMLHLGAVLSHAQWPAVTCMNMYVDQLVTQPLVVKGGYIAVPELPGLGVEFNEAALKYRVPGPEKPLPDAIYAIVRENGRRTWYPSEFGPHGFWSESWAGNVTMFELGVKLETRVNDGTKEYRELKERLKSGPVGE